MFLSFWPAAFFSPSDIKTIPNKNSPNPPIVPNIIVRIILAPTISEDEKQMTDDRHLLVLKVVPSTSSGQAMS
jgi:hypothetical protein